MSENHRKAIIKSAPYLVIFYVVNQLSEVYRLIEADSILERASILLANLENMFDTPFISFNTADLLVGLIGSISIYLIIYIKGKNAKKYRKGVEYGSARWGHEKDIRPYIDPIFEKNVLLTQTERLMMDSRPRNPKVARNKNVLVVGGSGSGKTRFFVKPNLMQMHSSYVVTDPKGTLLVECGKLLARGRLKKDENGEMVYEPYRIKILNTINFKKSMHYNPFAYIRSEKDILKLVNAIIVNTKGEGEKVGEDFWVKAEKLYYAALIGYIYYKAPKLLHLIYSYIFILLLFS